MCHNLFILICTTYTWLIGLISQICIQIVLKSGHFLGICIQIVVVTSKVTICYPGKIVSFQKEYLKLQLSQVCITVHHSDIIVI
jgi:hypothetical protein